jgi:hypothetical protein
VGGEVVGQGGEFGGVAAEPFHLVHRHDDPAVRRVGLDLAGQGERPLELGADPHPGADLLGEDLVAGDAMRGEGVELGLQLLRQRAAAGVADADVGGGPVVGDWPGRRGTGPPWLAGSAVGRGLHAQPFGQAWHLGEAAGVVGAGDGSGSGPAGRSGSDVAAGAGVELDFVGVTDGFGRVGSWIMGGLAGLR